MSGFFDVLLDIFLDVILDVFLDVFLNEIGDMVKDESNDLPILLAQLFGRYRSILMTHYG